MSFGFGDAVAALTLLERVATEIQHYRHAPQHFQQLGAELHLLQKTLRTLLHVVPSNDEEKERLEQIRAIALHCLQPILAFIDKMQLNEKSFGQIKTSGTLSALGSRIHWSMIANQDVDKLRKAIMAQMIAINLLLGMQQTASLSRLKLQVSDSNSEIRQFFATSHGIFTNSNTMFKTLEMIPNIVSSLQTITANQVCKQNSITDITKEKFNILHSTSAIILTRSKTTIRTLSKLRRQTAESMINLTMIARNIQVILLRLKTFSKKFSDQVAINTQKLMDIHAMMKRLIRAVEAIPLHLTVGIVRLDDALGESWGLPYQACQTLEAFTHILSLVVFGKNRPGAKRVNLGQFIVRSAQNGAILNSENWNMFVKQGSHLSQAMVLTETTQTELNRCPYPGCSGLLRSDDKICMECNKRSSYQLVTAPQFDFNGDDGLNHKALHRHYGPVQFDTIQFEEDEKLAFRNVHIVEQRRQTIKSHLEAKKILEGRPSDPSALQYLGWWHLCEEWNPESAVNYLTQSVKWDSTCMETHYLLGRALMAMTKFEECYNAYQQAVYLNGRSNILWISIGLLYFLIEQYRDCLDSFARAVRLQPPRPLVWRNLGILYDHCNNQAEDARDCYQRAQQLDPLDNESRDRVAVLNSCIAIGSAVPATQMQMVDYDLRKTDYSSQELNKNGRPARLPPLRLNDNQDDDN